MDEQLRFRKDERKVLGSGEYSVDHKSASHTIYTGLYAGDKIIALLVATDEDATAANIDAIGNRITRACNAHEQLVEALQEAKALLELEDDADYVMARIAVALAAAGAA